MESVGVLETSARNYQATLYKILDAHKWHLQRCGCLEYRTLDTVLNLMFVGPYIIVITEE